MSNALLQDSRSLTQAVVSKDAVIFRQHMSKTLADVIYKWMLRTLGGEKASALSDRHFSEIEREEDTALLLQNALRDRRLRVISYKIMKDVRRQPLLMLRACWCCLTIFATASAIALHRAMVYWSETMLKSVAFVSKRFAVSV